MTVAAVQHHSAPNVIKKRRTHTKSRQGCSNCKIRRIKCDEAKPTCRKCLDYGVSCKYGSKEGGELQLSVAGSFMVEVPSVTPTKQPTLNRTILSILNGPRTDEYAAPPYPVYHLNQNDLDMLKIFQTQTVQTIGTADTYQIYQREVVRLAAEAPFLMHIVLTLTHIYERFQKKIPKQSVTEAFHWYQGTALFNQVLSKPIKDKDKDALWACAALLGAIAFTAVDVDAPEQAWPLKAPSALDLDWLQMSDGKKEIARLADLSRPDSVFRQTWCSISRPIFEPTGNFEVDFGALPTTFSRVYDLTPLSTPLNNPYYRAALIVSQLLTETCNHRTILQYMSFIGFMPPEFKLLLENKDPRALLLMAYWYAKLCEYKQWWIHKRAFIECQSICIYLGRYHWHDVGLMGLLKFPISMCAPELSLDTPFRPYQHPS